MTIKLFAEYFDKLGYGLFAGGVVTLLVTKNWQISLPVIIIGFSCMIIGEINKRRLRNFKESIRKDILKKNSELKPISNLLETYL